MKLQPVQNYQTTNFCGDVNDVRRCIGGAMNSAKVAAALKDLPSSPDVTASYYRAQGGTMTYIDEAISNPKSFEEFVDTFDAQLTKSVGSGTLLETVSANHLKPKQAVDAFELLELEFKQILRTNKMENVLANPKFQAMLASIKKAMLKIA